MFGWHLDRGLTAARYTVTATTSAGSAFRYDTDDRSVARCLYIALQCALNRWRDVRLTDHRQTDNAT